MSTPLDEKTSITMPKGTLLILFEYLARSYESWLMTSDSTDDATFVLQKPDAGERIALWRFEGEKERTLAEIFSVDYAQLVSAWKQQLISDNR